MLRAAIARAPDAADEESEEGELCAVGDEWERAPPVAAAAGKRQVPDSSSSWSDSSDPEDDLQGDYF